MILKPSPLVWLRMWNPKKQNLLLFGGVLTMVLAGMEWWEAIVWGNDSIVRAILYTSAALVLLFVWFRCKASEEHLSEEWPK